MVRIEFFKKIFFLIILIAYLFKFYVFVLLKQIDKYHNFTPSSQVPFSSLMDVYKNPQHDKQIKASQQKKPLSARPIEHKRPKTCIF